MVAALFLVVACGDPPVTPDPDGGEETFGVASTAQIVAWEGQQRFVTVLTAERGESLDEATVEVADPATLEPLTTIDLEARLFVAAQVGRARLIDNISTLEPPFEVSS